MKLSIFNYLTNTYAHIIPIDGKTGNHFVWQYSINNFESAYDFVVADNTKRSQIYLLDDKLIIALNGKPII